MDDRSSFNQIICLNRCISFAIHMYSKCSIIIFTKIDSLFLNFFQMIIISVSNSTPFTLLFHFVRVLRLAYARVVESICQMDRKEGKSAKRQTWYATWIKRDKREMEWIISAKLAVMCEEEGQCEADRKTEGTHGRTLISRMWWVV